MREQIDFTSAPREAAQITSLRKSLMDFMEDEIAKLNPDIEVRDTFRRYAINEEKRSTLEKIFGGSISDRASFAKSIKPEDVLDRLFGNTVSIQAAKDILGSKFDEALSNYLKIHADQVTDAAKNGFSSAKFASFLRRKAPELETAFVDKPQALNRISALTDLMRILPDAPSVNPSGTAKTLTILQAAHRIGGALKNPLGALSQGAGTAIEDLAGKAEAAKTRTAVDLMLQGKSAEQATQEAEARMARYSVLKRLETISQKASNAIQSGAKALFRGVDDVTPYLSSKAAGALNEPNTDPDEYERRTNQITMYAQNPSGLIDKLENGTAALYPHAPQITASLHQAAVNAVGYLSSKIPVPDRKPLSPEWQPSPAEISKFNRHYDAIQDPTILLKQMQAGTLSLESLDAVRSVYPKLYQQMSEALVDRMSRIKGRIPYRTRLMLSMFLGEDLDHSTDPRAVMANQARINSPSLQRDNQIMQAHSTVKGLSKLSMSNRLLTPLQASSQRE